MWKQKRCDTIKNLLKIQESSTKPHQIIAKKSAQSGRIQVTVPISIMRRVKEVEENLNPKFPIFVKPMVRSNVTKGFWMSLPNPLRMHLPRQDATIILEDEDRRQYVTRYLFDRKGLSAGWKGFSDAHNLIEGDVLIFHMVKPRKFKVYIIRSSNLNEVDAALSLMHIEAEAKKTMGFRSAV